MIFIRTNPINETKEFVAFVHYMPEMLSDEELSMGYLIEEYVEPSGDEIPKYHTAVSFYNPLTNEIIWEFVQRPLTDKEIIELQQIQLANLNIAMANIMGVE